MIIKQNKSSNPDVGWAVPTNWISVFIDDLDWLSIAQYLKHHNDSRTWAVPTLQNCDLSD